MTDPIHAVLLDFDGTLVDSEPLHYEAWLHAVKPHGGWTDWPDYVARFVGKTDRWAARTFLENAGGELDDAVVGAVCEAKHAYFRQRAPERLRLTQGAADWILAHLTERLVGVVSSSLSRDVEPTLVRDGLRERLDVIVCGEHVQRHKPDPEPYLRALTGLRESRPDLQPAHTLVFEDSRSGQDAAAAAGMQVVAVDSPDNIVALMQARLR